MRVIASETNTFSLTLTRGVNDKIQDVAEEVSELIGENKYTLSFLYQN